ncbi:MAG: cobyric acid synthase [Anaerovoracaceae bacterium]
MKRYHHGGETADDKNIKYDFSVNLNPLGIPPAAVYALSGDRECFEKYPDTDCIGLKNAIAEALGMAEDETDRIVCGAGAADIIYRLPGALGIKKALLAVPSFTEYDRALIQAGVDITYVQTSAENSFAPADEIEQFGSGFDAVFIANPVNPSGKLMDAEDYRNLLEWCRETDTTLVTDECFIDFTEPGPRKEILDVQESVSGADVISVRSFTKIFSMAGLRCGFAVFSDREKALKTELASPPWNVSGPAATAAAAALGDKNFVEKTAELMSAERKRVSGGLKELGLEVFQSDANFVLFKAPEDFGAEMMKRGIAVRDCSDYRSLEPEEDLRYYRTALLGSRADSFLLDAAADALGREKEPGAELSGTEPQAGRRSGTKTPSIMIQGTMSNAGKSIIAAGLCRILRQDGFNPAPFKSQNMALNSFAAEGGEIGRAQAVQAEACGIPPETDMNPVLLKPSSDTGSQVIVNGRPRCNMDAADYFSYRKQLKDDVLNAYGRLASSHGVIVIEGAGSPAEINLTKDGDDFVNMGLAEMTDSPVLLVGDIDRGGVFAQLAGTLDLMSSPERRRVKGIIVNKFRGDISLFDEGRKMLEDVCGVPVLGVVPYGDFDIDDEDSLSERLENGAGRNTESSRRAGSRVPGSASRSPEKAREEGRPDGPLICVVRLPRISNFSDFTALETDGARVVYVSEPDGLAGADAVIIPGTKSTISDMMWMNETGMTEALREAAAGGTVVAGICGGYQMLGVSIKDPGGVESSVREVRGAGVLPVETVFSDDKITKRTSATAGKFTGIFSELDSKKIEGYEIHMGRTSLIAPDSKSSAAPDRTPDTAPDDNSSVTGGFTEEKTGSRGAVPFSVLEDGRTDGCACGNVFGTYIHGLFDSDDFRHAFLRMIGADGKNFSSGYRKYREEQFDKLADLLRENLDIGKIYEIAGLEKRPDRVRSSDRKED